MEPINTSADYSQVQVIDDHLEKIVQDFNEFRERMSQSSSSGAMKLEDIIDLYIDNSCENSYNKSHTTQGQFTTLLLQEDFNKFESTPPPYQVASTHKQSTTNGFSINREIQESQTVNINDANVGAGSNRVTYIRYGDLNYDGAAGDFIGRVFGGEMNFWWRGVCGNSRSQRAKRKYRGDIEYEEETARRVARTKMNNREAAAKTNANRKARDTYTRTQLTNLQRKNEFMKKLVIYLEGRERINLHPRPLRRTISGPR